MDGANLEPGNGVRQSVGGLQTLLCRELERLWIGADISAIAVEHVQERLKEKRHKKVKRDYVMKECR